MLKRASRTGGKPGVSGVDIADRYPYVPASFGRPQRPVFIYPGFLEMKIRNSLKALMTRHRANKLVRRRGRVYIINKTDKRYKARQG